MVEGGVENATCVLYTAEIDAARAWKEVVILLRLVEDMKDEEERLHKYIADVREAGTIAKLYCGLGYYSVNESNLQENIRESEDPMSEIAPAWVKAVEKEMAFFRACKNISDKGGEDEKK